MMFAPHMGLFPVLALPLLVHARVRVLARTLSKTPAGCAEGARGATTGPQFSWVLPNKGLFYHIFRGFRIGALA